VDYVYHKNQFDAGLIDQKNLITRQEIPLSHIHKHVMYPTEKSQVSLDIIFNQNDYDNLYFLCKYHDVVNDIIRRYSGLDIQFAVLDYSTLLFHNRLTLDFSVDTASQKISLSKRKRSVQEQFLLHYLQHIELIQICMSIYNDYERSSEERKRYPLKNTFAILSSARSIALDALVKDISVMHEQTKSVLIAKDSAKSDPKIGYQLCLSKIMHHIKYAQKQCERDMQSCIDDAIQHNEYIASLNDTLLRYMGYGLQVDYEDGLFYF